MNRSRIPLATLPLLLALGCVVVDDDEDPPTTGASATESGPTTEGTTAGSDSDETTTDGASTSETTTDGGTTSGSTTDGDSDSDATSGGGGSTGSGDSGSDEGGGTIDVTLTGCDVDLGGTVVVSFNGSLGVASVYDNGGTLSGSFQFDLQGTGSIALSTQHRVDTGEVINLVGTSSTWTNLDSASIGGGSPDRIAGTLTVNSWDPANGISDLVFSGVSLLNVSTDEVCTIDGTIVTMQLYP